MSAIRAISLGVLIGWSILSTGVLLLVLCLIGFALVTEPDEWKPGGGANIGFGLLIHAAVLNLPTLLGWLVWCWARTKARQAPGG